MVNKSLNKIKYTITILFCILILVTASYLLVTFFRSKELIYINTEVSISDIITINISLFLALVLPLTIGFSLENKKISKELLIKLCDKALLEILSFRDLITQIRIDISWDEKENLKDTILERTRYVWTNIQKLKTALLSEFPSVIFSGIDNVLDNLRSSASDDLRNRDFEFSISYKNEVQKRVRDMDDSLESLKFTINDQ